MCLKSGTLIFASALALFWPAYAVERVDGKVYKPGEYIHGTWPSTVSSGSCENPVYLMAGYLQGVAYAEGWYCADLSRLRIVPYETKKPSSK